MAPSAQRPPSENTLLDLHVEGERVHLRPTRADDAAHLFPLIHDREEILRWLCWPGPDSLEDYAEGLAAWRRGAADTADHHLAIVGPEGVAIGILSLRFSGHPGVGDVGYWIGAQHQGRGFATEALRLATHLAFDALGATSLVAGVFVGNEASRRMLERHGFSLVETLHGLHRSGGREIDEWQFALLASTWRRAQGPAPARLDVTWGSAPEGATLLEAGTCGPAGSSMPRACSTERDRGPLED